MNVSERRRLANVKERLQRNDCAGALRILQPLLPRKASEKSKATRARKRADDERKRQIRKLKSRALYEKVMSRAGWLCELGAHVPLSHVEMHHLKAGSAKRFYERVENCIRACSRCHRRWDNEGCEQFRQTVLLWCAEHGYPIPSVFLREPRAQRAPESSSPVHARVPAPQALGAVSGGEK